MSLGFSRIQSNALASIGSFMTLPVVFFFAWLSDKTQKRGLMVMVASTAYLISLIALKLVQPHVGRWSKFGLWTTVNSLAVGYHPIHNAWIQMNSPDPEERSICMVWVSLKTSILCACWSANVFRMCMLLITYGVTTSKLTCRSCHDSNCWSDGRDPDFSRRRLCRALSNGVARYDFPSARRADLNRTARYYIPRAQSSYEEKIRLRRTENTLRIRSHHDVDQHNKSAAPCRQR